MLNRTVPPEVLVAAESTTENYVYLPSDYVQIVLFSLFMLIGLPVNISTLLYMLKRYRHGKSFLLLLHINLNISDILVLGVYVPGLLGWLITYEWKAGDTVCRLMRFIDAFVFALSSNIMVCIAVYRLSALRNPTWVSAVGHNNVPRMLVAAWLLAALFMSPQIFVWREASFATVDGRLNQCVTVWTEKMNHGENLTQQEHDVMIFYNIQSVVVIFYIPLVVLVVCYVLIVKDIYATLRCTTEASSAMYMSEISKFSTSSRNRAVESKKERESCVSINARLMRGQEKFHRRKVRSLRITLTLILTYVITWLPYNLLAWWIVISFDSYRVNQDVNYYLTCFVVLNSVINPFIYGRWQGIKLLFSCRSLDKKSKRICQMLK